MISQPSVQSYWQRNWQKILGTVIAVGLVYVLSKNTATLSASLEATKEASIENLLIALIFVPLLFVLSVYIYTALALKPISLKQTFLVELASAAVNRILPSGIGGLSIHGVYLYKKKHTVPQVSVVLGINNLIGITAHLLILVTVLLLSPHSFRSIDVQPPVPVLIGGALLVGVAILVLFVMRSVRMKIIVFIKDVLQSIHHYSKKPSVLVLSFVSALLLTCVYTVIFYLTVQSFDIKLPLLSCFIIFSIGVFAGALTPTPGGVVGAEAGLFAGFLSYGIQPEVALAAALVFRLLAYWLPVIPGLFAFIVLRKNKTI